jgi:uncharacterized membrane protein
MEGNKITGIITKIVVRNVNFLNKKAERVAAPVFVIVLKLVFFLSKRIKMRPWKLLTKNWKKKEPVKEPKPTI